MERREYLASGLAIGVSLVTGCLGGGGTVKATDTSRVEWQSFKFQPTYISVEKGETVTWVNNDPYNHTVTAASDNWSMDATVPAGGKVRHTFEQEGVYTVKCTEHGTLMKIAVGDAQIKETIQE